MVDFHRHPTSKANEYTTPAGLFSELDMEFLFTLDPCATTENAKCAKFYTYHENGLIQDWSGETVFMNPPQGGETEKWMAKAFRESLKGATVVCLVPAYTGTKWWHEYAMKGEIRYIKGKLKFGDCKYQAPFYSVIVIFRATTLGLGL